MLEVKSIDFGNNKSVDIYDGLFTFAEMSGWFTFIQNSLYRVDGKDSEHYRPYADQVFSRYSMDDLKRMGMLESEGFQFINKKYGLIDKEIQTIRVNLSTPAEKNIVHTDTLQGKTFIFYANLDWQLEWGGHTLFMDEKLTDAKCTCLYKPGRVVVFDGAIPHMIMTPTVLCPTNRYTFVIQTK
jgi:hypothetical protein